MDLSSHISRELEKHDVSGVITSETNALQAIRDKLQSAKDEVKAKKDGYQAIRNNLKILKHMVKGEMPQDAEKRIKACEDTVRTYEDETELVEYEIRHTENLLKAKEDELQVFKNIVSRITTLTPEELKAFLIDVMNYNNIASTCSKGARFM